MGFASLDAVYSAMAAGQFWRTDLNKITGTVGASTAGRWYDFSMLTGSPLGISYGEMVYNRAFIGGSNYWTLADLGWVWTANTMTHVAAVGVGTLSCSSMQKVPVAGRSYRVTTVVSALGGVGTLGVTLGGTAGVAIAGAGTNVQTIGPVAGAGLLTYTPSNIGLTCTITSISVIEPLQSFIMNDTVEGAPYLGGAVAGGGFTKHILNAGVVTGAATVAPCTFLLVDLLLCYPGIGMGAAAAGGLQTMLNVNAIPRYTTGDGVKAFLVTTVNTGATAHNILLRYTQNGGAAPAGRHPPVTIADTVSSLVGQIPHSGVAASNYGPFIPLQHGDTGVLSVDTFQTSAAVAGTGEAALVLCKPLIELPMTTINVMAERNYLHQFASMPKIIDGACLGIIQLAGAATPNSSTIYGYLEFVWG